MISLRDTQALFWRAMSWPTGIDDFLAQADAATREAFASTFADSPDFSRRERVTVYAESYFWRLSEVLREQYRVTAWLLGPVRFHNLVTDYVLQHPSGNPDIRAYGGPLLAFLADHAVASEVPGLMEVARVDRSMVTALDAADGPTADVATLAAVPLDAWPGLRLRPSVGLQLWSVARPYPTYWQTNDQEQPSPDPVPPLDGRTHRVQVWRHQYRVLHRSVPEAEARALQAMIEGAPFSEICAAAAGPAGDEAEASHVVQWLRRWLERGMVGAVETTP
ncbi:MAG: DNA-binding domain-containing protein [Deltaproteobacteria bacterium]|nr:DNA-binding domain-containing protein [Deltaproteobacteria bacterium]